MPRKRAMNCAPTDILAEAGLEDESFGRGDGSRADQWVGGILVKPWVPRMVTKAIMEL
jgi:hypothetical protein